MTLSQKELGCWLALLRAPEIGPCAFKKLLKQEGGKISSDKDKIKQRN